MSNHQTKKLSKLESQVRKRNLRRETRILIHQLATNPVEFCLFLWLKEETRNISSIIQWSTWVCRLRRKPIWRFFLQTHEKRDSIVKKFKLIFTGGYNGDKDGYAIPPGTDIFISVSRRSSSVFSLFIFCFVLNYHNYCSIPFHSIQVYNLHRSPYFWDNPNDFEPERFLQQKKSERIEGWAGFDPYRSPGALYPNEVILPTW